MPQAGIATSKIDWPQEDARLCALASTEILDTAPEPSFDAITRLSAEYFHADTVLLGFADESRVWIKSYWGEPVRELPRKQSIFDMVLAEDGPVVVPDISKHPHFEGGRMTLRRLGGGLVCQRSGALLRRQDSGRPDDLRMSAAPQHGPGRVADAGEPGRYGGQPAGTAQAAQELQEAGIATASRCRSSTSREPGRASPICATPWTSASLCSTTSRRSSSRRAGLSALKR